MLSDVVVCGPASVCLTKPAVLRLPHCAHDVDHQWSFTVIFHPLPVNGMSDVADTWRVCHTLLFTLKFQFFCSILNIVFVYNTNIR